MAYTSLFVALGSFLCLAMSNGWAMASLAGLAVFVLWQKPKDGDGGRVRSREEEERLERLGLKKRSSGGVVVGGWRVDTVLALVVIVAVAIWIAWRAASAIGRSSSSSPSVLERRKRNSTAVDPKKEKQDFHHHWEHIRENWSEMITEHAATMQWSEKYDEEGRGVVRGFENSDSFDRCSFTADMLERYFCGENIIGKGAYDRAGLALLEQSPLLGETVWTVSVFQGDGSPSRVQDDDDALGHIFVLHISPQGVDMYQVWGGAGGVEFSFS